MSPLLQADHSTIEAVPSHSPTLLSSLARLHRRLSMWTFHAESASGVRNLLARENIVIKA
jgi:hypothetical protein